MSARLVDICGLLALAVAVGCCMLSSVLDVDVFAVAEFLGVGDGLPEEVELVLR